MGQPSTSPLASPSDQSGLEGRLELLDPQRCIGRWNSAGAGQIEA